MSWNPSQYDRFRQERRQPFRDLLALVEPAPGLRVVDLGCGTGEPTRELHDALPGAETLGVDSSPEMLAEAARHATPTLRFELGTIEGFRPERALDLVFSNAAFHWVPDHEALFARLAGFLSPGGQLAVQMPDMREQPSHQAALDVAREEPFQGALHGFTVPAHVLSPDAYARLLFRLGFAEQTVRLQVYPHVLPSREEVVEWVKGTTLTPYRDRLTDEMYAAFLHRYRERLAERIPDERPLLFPYRRLLLWARRGA